MASTCAIAAGSFRGVEYQTRFIDLARALGTLGVWVRMHYVYPYPHVDAVHAADGRRQSTALSSTSPSSTPARSVLQRMARPAHAEKTLDRIHQWRREVPGLTLRSTFIVGFPGETEAEFQQLLDWLDEAQLDRVGCFKYSPVEGAPANTLGEPVPTKSWKSATSLFMERAIEISEARLAQRIGQTITVLVDRIEDGVAIARSSGDAPEIDGAVQVLDGGAPARG
jgi:ribosomal protein S12 methylthiotransferase